MTTVTAGTTKQKLQWKSREGKPRGVLGKQAYGADVTCLEWFWNLDKKCTKSRFFDFAKTYKRILDLCIPSHFPFIPILSVHLLTSTHSNQWTRR